MNSRFPLIQELSLSLTGRRGQVIPTVMVMMAVLLGSVALAVDVGFVYVTRAELQTVADGSALAATRTLGNTYQQLTYDQQQGFVCADNCQQTLRDVAQDVASKNLAAGDTMSVRIEDVLIGQWDGENFTETNTAPDAVHVIARRDSVANGPITTFFARILDIPTGSVVAEATAALTAQGTAGPGELELPIGISSYFFEQDLGGGFCDEDIQFYPSNDPTSCAGWTSWDYGSNDATLRKILDENPNYPSPETIAGETYFAFTGGTLSNPTFDALLSLFQRKGYDIDANGNYLLDDQGLRIHQATSEQGAVPLMEEDNKGQMVQAEYPDGTPRNLHKWETTLPVYDRGDCSNPNQTILIVGFAEIDLRTVLNSPDKLVRGMLKCNYVDEFGSRGGGGEFGTRGSIPGLVR